MPFGAGFIRVLGKIGSKKGIRRRAGRGGARLAIQFHGRGPGIFVRVRSAEAAHPEREVSLATQKREKGKGKGLLPSPACECDRGPSPESEWRLCVCACVRTSKRVFKLTRLGATFPEEMTTFGSFWDPISLRL